MKWPKLRGLLNDPDDPYNNLIVGILAGIIMGTVILGGALVIGGFKYASLPSVRAVGSLIALFSGVVFKYFWNLKAQGQQQRQRRDLQEKVDKEPTKIKPVWELAAFTLETYFQRNLKQVRAIFWVSNLVMFAGFAVIVWGIKVAVDDPNRVKIGVIASASGILTEFISLTFMAIYRSTMAQANEYVSVLERINTVGMAVQVLDSMDKDDKESTELKNVTRVDIVRLLLTPRGTQPAKPRSRLTKIKAKSEANDDV
jgi:TRADD-N domain-containing protein